MTAETGEGLGQQAILSALFREHESLWTEKLLHKRYLRLAHLGQLVLLVVVLTAIGVAGSQLRELVQDGSIVSPGGAFGTLSLVAFASLPPISLSLLLVTSVLSIEMFQIHVIGRQVAAVERRTNELLGSPVLTWEHRIVPAVYHRHGQWAKRNVIVAADQVVFSLTALGVLLAGGLGAVYLLAAAGFVAMVLYLIVLVSVLVASLVAGYRLLQVLAPDSEIHQVIDAAWREPNQS